MKKDKLPMTKSQWRKQYLALRRNMTDSVQKSEKIARRLYGCGIKKYSHVFSYLSFANEVDTHQIICQLLEWGVTVSVPVCDIHTCTMTASQITDFSHCSPNSYGILEPQTIVVPDSPFDAVLVPGVVFSKAGHRIGFGKGYYDRFLSSMANHPYKIGLCYDWQLTETLPHEPHDVSMDLILTDERTLRI